MCRRRRLLFPGTLHRSAAGLMATVDSNTSAPERRDSSADTSVAAASSELLLVGRALSSTIPSGGSLFPPSMPISNGGDGETRRGLNGATLLIFPVGVSAAAPVVRLLRAGDRKGEENAKARTDGVMKKPEITAAIKIILLCRTRWCIAKRPTQVSFAASFSIHRC